MIVLIIIGAVILIFAIVNWEQSNGFIRQLFDPNRKLLESNEIDSIKEDSNGTVSLNADMFSDEDYARDDDTDYI